MAHNNARNPLMKGDTETEVVNNVVYNWGGQATAFGDLEGAGPSTGNVIGNSYIPGADSNTTAVRISTNVSAGTLVYVRGNVGPGRETDQGDEWLIVDGDEQFRSDTPAVPPSGIGEHTAAEAYDLVLQHAGANAPYRDPIDTRIVASVTSGTGNIIDSQTEVGGWPDLAGGTAPVDSDHDGMPDDWETARDLDPNDAADGNHVAPNGYTWVEVYINGLIVRP
jgi:hypothetical protein